MKNYDVNSAKIFETTQHEMMTLPPAWNHTKEKFTKNFEMVRNYFQHQYGLDAADFTVRHLPIKRNNWDNAVLLCIRTHDLKYYAKRHKNNQTISIKY